jgi:hypothetical protein
MTVVPIHDDLDARAKISRKRPALTVQTSTLTPPDLMKPDDRKEAGKRLRDKVSHASHGVWHRHRPAGRPDPIDILRAADVTRQPDLVPLRYGRMLQSPFTFYRGSAAVMAADLVPTPATGIHVQACGDAHLMNFGAFATPKRRLIFDVNDLDETLPAPWEWDVKRLAASFALAARANGLSDDDGREAAIACARSYRQHMRDFSAMDVIDIWYARLDDTDMIPMFPKGQRDLAAKRIAKATAASSSGTGLSEASGRSRQSAPHSRGSTDDLSPRRSPPSRIHGPMPRYTWQIPGNPFR